MITLFSEGRVEFECQIEYMSGSAVSDQPITTESKSCPPCSPYFGSFDVFNRSTSASNDSVFGSAFTPICLNCSAATWMNVSRILLPEFVMIENSSFCPFLA
jgi:hypothetical protein